jgi:hypothetical protein
VAEIAPVELFPKKGAGSGPPVTDSKGEEGGECGHHQNTMQSTRPMNARMDPVRGLISKAINFELDSSLPCAGRCNFFDELLLGFCVLRRAVDACLLMILGHRVLLDSRLQAIGNTGPMLTLSLNSAISAAANCNNASSQIGSMALSNSLNSQDVPHRPCCR